MTQQTMIRYLGWLREWLNDRDAQCRVDHVLMDIYPVHVTARHRCGCGRGSSDLMFISFRLA
jgi:hypothetical protein